ncbi:GNAT family N-acetyltransferase [Streptomyces sp. NBC_00012]
MVRLAGVGRSRHHVLDADPAESFPGQWGQWLAPTGTMPGFVVRERGRVLAAAGYRAWPRRTAHIGVLTAPEARGRGLARVTGSAAVAHALAVGLLPQWRARPPASRRVAAALGFEELGSQLSIEIAAATDFRTE